MLDIPNTAENVILQDRFNQLVAEELDKMTLILAGLSERIIILETASSDHEERLVALEP